MPKKNPASTRSEKELSAAEREANLKAELAAKKVANQKKMENLRALRLARDAEQEAGRVSIEAVP